MVSFIGGFSSIRFLLWNTCIIQQAMSATNRKSIEEKHLIFFHQSRFIRTSRLVYGMYYWCVWLTCSFFSIWRSTEALTIHQVMSAAVRRRTSNLSRKKHLVFFYPLRPGFIMTHSPSSCGSSWQKTVMVVAMPTEALSVKAAPIARPSAKLCKASPSRTIRISDRELAGRQREKKIKPRHWHCNTLLIRSRHYIHVNVQCFHIIKASFC